MKNTFLFALGMISWLAGGTAVACSCRPRGIVEDFERATDIVVARVVSVTQELVAGDQSGRFVVENASFDVIETIKGTKKVADRIRVRSNIGSCGRSARNSPMWLEQAPSPGAQPELPKAVAISDTWLIYGDGEEPYELSHCSRSLPIELVDKQELETLRQLIRTPEDRRDPSQHHPPEPASPSASQ